MREIVTLSVGGLKISGWKSITITRSLKEASAAFAMSLIFTDPDSGVILDIQPDMDCEVSTRPDGAEPDTDELLISGITTDDDVSESGTSLSFEVNGKSHAQRLVKNSCVHSTGRLANLTPLQIAQTLAKPFDVTVIATTDVGAAIPVFRLEPGEKVFEAIERACRDRGLLLTDDEQGRLVLCRVGAERNDAIEYGGAVDVTRWAHSRSAAERYTEYRCIGQRGRSKRTFGDAIAATSSVVKDSGWTTRSHVLTIIADGETDAAGCRDRARWEAAVRSGEATKLRLTVRGWRSPSGKLWRAGQLVRVKYARRDIDRDMIIASTVLRQDDNGTVTELELMPPSAFSPQPPAKRKKSGNWVEDWGTV